jgi:hypothetical protein
MQLKTTPLCLALTSTLLATPALAGDLLHWQNNSLTYLYGQDYKIDPDTQQTGDVRTCQRLGLGRHVLLRR